MENETPVVVCRDDYAPPSFFVDRVHLEFDLDPDRTTVRARLELKRNSDQSSHDLQLDGEQLELVSLRLNGSELDASAYHRTTEGLTIPDVPDEAVLETEVTINPAANKSLYGLYQSDDVFCTQCEALGFRKITFFPDRPDVMARYRVTLRADRTTCPVLLSNGNRISETALADNRHEVVWEDPFPKPSYLFALVAGDLKCHSGSFVTHSGREVSLEIWVEPENITRCDHALVSLQKSMQWDEEVFGLEYDLDTYMIVAVNAFNMGAMENKGLNIFNSKFVLASPETATDDDYLHIEAVIAHEYFHNWTGNRVTCRDWFQLTLKEGLTVFRDQQFTADQTSAAVKRIDDVASLRARQFPEDAGPMSHPIRPETYISMDNFYTATVYDKGAEVIRMYHTRLGQAGFSSGMDLYFARHDGAAVTCDDFRAAMADANDVDFSLMDRWYSQPGTPTLSVEENWDAAHAQFSLRFKQSYPELPLEIPGAEGRLPVPIPISVGLLDDSGKECPLKLVGEGAASSSTRVLLLEEEQQTFTFESLSSRPVPSILRNYSAPVRLRIERNPEELAFLMAHDRDSFVRWDSGQQLATQILLDLAARSRARETLEYPGQFIDAFGKVLADDRLDGAFKALALMLPAESVLAQEMEEVDPTALHRAREFLKVSLARSHGDRLLDIYQDAAFHGSYSNDQESINRRRLKNTVLAYLATLRQRDTILLLDNQFRTADNMTDTQAALFLLADQECTEREDALKKFYNQWRHDALVLDKWFTAQAAAQREDSVEQVRALTEHPDFRLANPNRVRSLLTVFAQNQVRFHSSDGSGYTLMGEFVLRIDPDNHQLAARLVSCFNSYRRFEPRRQQLMRDQLEQIGQQDGLSKDVYEVVQRALSF